MVKRFFSKFLVLFLVFFAVLGGYGIKRLQAIEASTVEEESKLMGNATLPVLHTMVAGMSINEIHGYTMKMDQQYMRDNLIILADQQSVSLRLEHFGQSVIGMSYTLRDPAKKKVVDKGDLKGWDAGKKYVTLSVDFSGLQPDKEYYFELKISTEAQKNIHYYALLKYEDNTNAEDHLAFIQTFSDATLDYEAAVEQIVPYIEPSGDNANNNLGHVDITSSLRQITYQSLEVRRVTDPTITAVDLTPETGCYVMRFILSAKNEYGMEERYEVREYYRVCEHNGMLFLITYDRTMNQVYDPASANTNTKRMNLGIDSDLKVDYLYSSSGNYIAFENCGSLYMMDIDKNQVTRAFTFSEGAEDGSRENYGAHGIKIVSVSKEGDIDFLVYGYMNRGDHEGKAGVTLYRYYKEKNIVEERIYIPSEQPYEVLKQVIGSECYIKDNNILYLYMDNNIYSVDIEGKLYVEIVSNVNTQDLAVSDTGNRIAWRDGNNLRVLNLDTSDENLIEGSSKKRLVPLGFMGEDFVYGTAKSSNVIQNDSGDETVLLSSLDIVGPNMKNQKTYKKKDKYLLDVTVTESIIDVTLVKKVKTSVDSKGYQKEGTDQIVNNIEPIQQLITTNTITTELKQTEMILEYATYIISSDAAALVEPDQVLTNASNALSIKPSESKDSNYYVYGYGKLQNIVSNAARGEELGQQYKGYAVNGKGIRIYEYEEKFAQ